MLKTCILKSNTSPVYCKCDTFFWPGESLKFFWNFKCGILWTTSINTFYMNILMWLHHPINTVYGENDIEEHKLGPESHTRYIHFAHIFANLCGLLYINPISESNLWESPDTQCLNKTTLANSIFLFPRSQFLASQKIDS